jgi:hypothetical protein
MKKHLVTVTRITREACELEIDGEAYKASLGAALVDDEAFKESLDIPSLDDVSLNDSDKEIAALSEAAIAIAEADAEGDQNLDWEIFSTDYLTNVDQDVAAHIEKAREYQTDNLEIDEGPEVLRGEGGMWVSAWIFVSDEEVKPDRNDEQRDSGASQPI